jgi:hypothetical protein
MGVTPVKAGPRAGASSLEAWILACAGVTEWEHNTELVMRAEIQAVADDIQKSLALLRRHL